MSLNMDCTYETVQLYTTDKVEDPNPQVFTYYLDYTYEQLLDVSVTNLKLPKSVDYQILFRDANGQPNWIIKGQTLRDIGARPGNMIHVLPSEVQTRAQPTEKQVYEFAQNEDYTQATLIGNGGEVYRFADETAEAKHGSDFRDTADEFGGAYDGRDPGPLAMTQIDRILGQKRDATRDAAIHKRGAECGIVEEQFQWALCLRDGRGCDRDVAEAARFFKLAACAGSVKAQYNYGMMLRDGDGVEANVPQALVYLKRAADRGHPGAQYAYGAMLMNGEGTERDPETARMYIEEAAAQGEEQALQFLGHFEVMYQKIKAPK